MVKVVTAPRVNSEINKLKMAILHRPGKELERLTPQNLSELLFDDIPWVRRIQEEHDNFVKVLQQNRVEVLYLQNLLEEILKEENVKEKFIDELLQVNGVTSPKINNYLKEFLKEKFSNEVAEIAIGGLTLNEIKIKKNL